MLTEVVSSVLGVSIALVLILSMGMSHNGNPYSSSQLSFQQCCFGFETIMKSLTFECLLLLYCYYIADVYFLPCETEKRCSVLF